MSLTCKSLLFILQENNVWKSLFYNHHFIKNTSVSFTFLFNIFLTNSKEVSKWKEYFLEQYKIQTVSA